ncbi:MarR family transcriptional regulator [Acidisoma cellulosilytica]|uniref:MarR family transcriptional regulator n=1 Tax=Acidisoma cellulosilyticum TaxID=2802395 RepID=A0A963Z3H7_9PROT|nr:MarR family transcriptional regulator [Acidisoma cellulosilyticum]MCB8881814.1 MarR family transcriptional regulator [Acidisoma cellulosilyticum]
MRATEFGRLIYRISIAWRREIDVRVRDFGLTEATWRPLLYLGRMGDGQRQTDLAAALMIEAASLVRLVDALERAGLAERVEDPDDRRSKRITMTEQGRAIYARVDTIHQGLAETFVKDIPPEEMTICASVLERIEQAIESQSARIEIGDGEQA